MAAPTVILDLSPLARLTTPANWHTVEAMVRDWHTQFGSSEVTHGVADNSLWYQLDAYGRQELASWKRRGRAQAVPWADPVILNLAETFPRARVLTTDLFRDHRRAHQWLQGTDRVYGPTPSASGFTFAPLNLAPIPEHEISMRIEEADLTPKGMNTPEGRELLTFEWACSNPNCAWGANSVIGVDPVNREGRACCPTCGELAVNRGKRELTREIVVLLGDLEPDRLPVAAGMTITFGRGRGESRYDVRELLDEDQSRLISRDHFAISNTSGRVTATDLGSRNGTELVRNGKRFPMQPQVRQVVELEDRIEVAGGAIAIRLSGRRRPRGAYAPDLSTAPWVNPVQPGKD